MTVSQQTPLPYVPGQTSDAPPRQWLTTALFLLPTVVLLSAYLIYPLLSSFWLSMLNWNGLGQTAKFVWFGNWVAMVQDPQFLRALANNGILAVVSVAVQIPIGLGLAVLLDKAGKRSRILKIIYFLPLLMSSVAVGVLFKNFYDPNFGPLNTLLNAIGLGSWAVDWLGDPRWSLISTAAVVCWQSIPFYMILFLAGLASMPGELREAAVLDGANEWTIFFRITLPYLAGTIRTAVLLVIIGSLRYFDLVFVMTGGGPDGSSELMATYMYRQVFNSFQLGYGSTIASGMFVIVVLAAGLGMRLTRRFETEV